MIAPPPVLPPGRTESLHQIQTPTLILVAEDSVANNSERTQALAALTPNAQLLAIPGTTGYVRHSAPEKCVTGLAGVVGLVSYQLIADGS